MNFHHKYFAELQAEAILIPPTPSLPLPPTRTGTHHKVDRCAMPRNTRCGQKMKQKPTQREHFQQSTSLYVRCLGNETETNSTAIIFLTKQLSICLVFWKMKRKPTAQREHFQQTSYLSARCFAKLNGNQQHSENTSNKAVIPLFGVLEN